MTGVHEPWLSRHFWKLFALAALGAAASAWWDWRQRPQAAGPERSAGAPEGDDPYLGRFMKKQRAPAAVLLAGGSQARGRLLHYDGRFLWLASDSKDGTDYVAIPWRNVVSIELHVEQ
jgi:hypothetical protein